MENLPIVEQSLLPISESEIGFFNFPKVTDNDFAIMFDNFLRDNLMWQLIKSIQQFYPTVKMYIAEQGVYHPVKDILYQKLQESGHEIIYTGFDAGLGVCRNKLIKTIEEPFVFYCDSDNLFTEETKIEKLLEILKNNPKIGLVATLETKDNKVWHYENNLSIENKKIVYKNAFTPEIEKNNEEFFICDMTMNGGLFNKKLFTQVMWDECMKLAEHCDFFLQIKYLSDFKVACSKNIKLANLGTSFNNPIYDSYRKRNKDYWILYKDKWNVISVDGWKIPEFVSENKIEKNPIEEKKEVVVPINQKTEIQTPAQLIRYLINNKIVFWLLKDSCLHIIRCSNLETLKDLYIGVKTNGIKEKIIELTKKCEFTLNIDIEPIRKTKNYPINDVNILVPVPVVEYLSKLYNKSFKQLMEEK